MRTTVKSFSQADPVSLNSGHNSIELRIGPKEQGKTRYARLTASQARQLAYALLHAAEAVQENLDFDKSTKT